MRFDVQLAKLPGKTQIHLAPGEWVRERKWDGMRAIFELSPDGTRIFSRTGQDLLPQFPELWAIHLLFDSPCVLDGEIVALSPENPDLEVLELLQMRAGDKQARRLDEIPVDVRFFDILELGTSDLRDLPLETRQSTLGYLLDVADLPQIEILPDGAETPSHWEGTVAKRKGSRYCSGKRNADWLKFKFTQRATLRAVGLTPGKNARSDSFGAILVEDENGVPRGQVGSGFPDAALTEIMDTQYRLGVQGLPLIEVEYRFISKTGLMVNTAFKGFRPDKEVADVL